MIFVDTALVMTNTYRFNSKFKKKIFDQKGGQNRDPNTIRVKVAMIPAAEAIVNEIIYYTLPSKKN